MKRLKFIVLTVLLCALAVTGLVHATHVLAATPTQTACQAVSGNASCTDTSGGPSIQGVVPKIINILSIIVGVISVIMIIIGGLRYVTSGGDSNNVSSAKNTIIYALVGLVIVALAQVIVKFVITKVR